MNLLIQLDGNNITIAIKKNKKTAASFSWSDEYSLSEKLLPNIDALLRKNRIDKKEIKTVTAKISRTSGVTSSRIVQTVAKAWNTTA